MSEFVPLVASIDIGTTSTRAILFNKNGQEVSKHQIEYSTSASKDKAQSQAMARTESTPIFSSEGIAITTDEHLEIEDLNEDLDPTLQFPRPGWVECKPVNILANAVQCLTATIISMDKLNDERKSHNLLPYKLVAIGVANMRETTVIWSKKTGKPLYNGVVWNDTRTSQIVSKIKASNSEEKLEALRQKCGLPISTYFSSSKVRWLLDNVDEVKAAYAEGDAMFGTIDTWLIYHLTKQNAFVSDVTNASRTSFMNLDTLDYDDESLKFWGVDKTKLHLPKIVSSAEYYGGFAVPDLHKLGKKGALSADAQKFLSTVLDVPVQGCLGDQSASLVGQLALSPGAAKCTYGTGAFLLYNTGSQKLISKHGALTTFGYWFPSLENEEHAKPHYALEGSIAVAGSVVQWLRDNLRLIGKASDVGPLASQVNNSGGVVFVPAFSGLFAPYWDSEARGTILGLTQYTTAAHIARAALEGVCYQVRAILKAMASDAGANEDFLDEAVGTYEKSPLSLLAVDGGMSNSKEVMQIQANILGPCVTVKRSPNAECTALGAAIAAGLAFKNKEDRVWVDLKDVVTSIRGDEIEGSSFVSKTTDEQRRKKWSLWERAIERAKAWAIEDHEDLDA